MISSARRTLLGATLLVGVFASRPASAKTTPAPTPSTVFVWLPGNPREISRLWSASRDTPILELSYNPTLNDFSGVDFGLAALRLRPVTLRFGMYGMVHIEDVPHFWRGLIGWSLALSADSWAHRLLGPGGGLELTLVAGHESDHRSDSSPFNDAPHKGDLHSGGGGDFITIDVAARFPLGMRASLLVRLLDRVFLRGAMQQAPAIDVTLRVRALDWLWPTASVFVEGLIEDKTNNGYNVRGLLGLGLRGAYGEVTPVGSGNSAGGVPEILAG